MPLSGSWSRVKRAALALGLAGPALAVPHVVPQEQAARFCRLLVCDNDNRLMPLSAFVHHKTPQQNDSLTIEQLFLVYVVDYDGWQTLRIFPHKAVDGTVRWYAPSDVLPQDVSEEHRKYIREVFPRLIAKISAGNWQTVDAYIDRMLQYQCQFGAGRQSSRPSSVAIIGIFAVLLLLLLLFFNIPKVLSFPTYSYLCTHDYTRPTERRARQG